MSIRLLVTMRDMAAAAHLREVVRATLADTRFNVCVYAQRPASSLLEQAGITHKKIDLPPAASPQSTEGTALLARAKAILNEEKPDIVLCGLSTPMDGGLDEAILANANVPTFLLQDFWGEQNRFFGKGAQTAFVLDEMAEKRNRDRFDAHSIVSGSARHGSYKKTNWVQRRDETRARLGVPDDKRVIGFFGQALGFMPGYQNTVSAFANAVCSLGDDIILSVRSHPREKLADREDTHTAFQKAGIQNILFMEDGPVEDALSACDVACSLFSNCTYDAAYLNWFSERPLCVPVSMLFDPEIASYCGKRITLTDLPIHAHGLVQAVYDESKLSDVLKNALRDDTRKEIWQRAREILPDPARACAIILDAMAQAADKKMKKTGT